MMMNHDFDSKTRSRPFIIKNLTVRYGVALAILVLLALGNFLLLKKEIQVNATNAAILNISGRQRTLVQRSLLLAEHLFIAQDPAKRAHLRRDLSQAADLLEKSHRALLEGDASLHLPGHPSEKVRGIYWGSSVSLDSELRGFLEALSALVKTPDAKLTLNDPNLQYVLSPDRSEKLLRDFDTLVNQYQREADANIRRLERLDFWILAMTLAILAITAFSIFHPMVRSMQREMEKSRLEGERVNLMIQQVPAILWTTDRELKFTMGVGAALGNLGVKPNQFNGVSLYEYLQTRDPEFLPIAAHLRALQGESNGYNMDWQGRSFHSYVEPLHDSAGQIIGVIGVALDTTERRKAEEDFEKSFSLLSATLESTADGILVVDTEGRIVRYNRKFLEMWHISDEVLASGDDSQAITFVLDQLKDPEGFLSKVRALYGHPMEESYDTLDFKDGRVFERFSKPQMLSGKVVGRVWSFRDATESRRAEQNLKRMNEELVRLNQIKSEFTSMVSHELRTPLSSIKESIDIVLDGIDGPVTMGQRETLEIAKRNVDRLARLIGNVLDFSRLESGKMEMIFVKISLIELLNEVYNFMKPAVQKKDLEFSLELPSEAVTAVCDADKIKQIVINLVDNAVKFTPPHERIVIRLTEEGEKARIDVEDTGIGIKKEDQKRIFEMFAQAEDRRGGKIRGTGIGLALCKKIIEQHGGEIRVESELGKGSRFSIIFWKNIDSLALAKPEAH
jgi:PAS domain S-box-containing protein